MNDGIYHPFDGKRFRKYQEGLIRLREQAATRGVKVMHLTPPVFDPVPIRASTLPAGLAEYPKPFEGYDDVLTRYSDWLVSRRSEGWDVVDIHGPMKALLETARQRDPRFRLAGDGVHIDAVGHWSMARSILIRWGVPADSLPTSATGDEVLATLPQGLEVLKLVRQKQGLLRDAWLSATEHRRPGIAKGLPLKEAEEKARALDLAIQTLVKAKP